MARRAQDARGSAASAPARSSRSVGAARRGAARPTPPRTGARTAGRAHDRAPSVSYTAWEWLRTLVGAFAIYFVVQAFLIQAFRIPSGSMEPTLLVGDWLFVNKAIYGPKVPLTHLHLPAWTEPKRGGIVVFESPIEPGLNLVKRVIGTGGDTLAMRDGRLILNGKPQPERYAVHKSSEGNVADPAMSWQRRYLVPGRADPASYQPTRDDWGPIVVPGGHLFMMGDNRDASFDSRYYGFVERPLIKGKPLFIYYSYAAKSGKPLPFLTAIRWDRIGNTID